MTYQLPKLNYSYDALEPYIDARTMEIHYTKHHATYVAKLNEAIASINYDAPADVNELISDLKKVPESIRTAVRNQGGGHANHTFFWEIISPHCGTPPKGLLAESMNKELAEEIKKEYGSVEVFKEKFAEAEKKHDTNRWNFLSAINKFVSKLTGTNTDETNDSFRSFFAGVLGDCGGVPPQGELLEAINKEFGSLDAFKEKFAAAASGRFGSGWAWLCVKPEDKSLCICSTANQDSPLMAGIVECPGKPILGLDVWEHAYYLHYQNRRPEYITAFWNVVNWTKVAEHYKNAKNCKSEC